MAVPSLDEALIRVTVVFPYAMEFILAAMAFFGAVLVLSGLYGSYRTITEAGRGQSYGQRPNAPWSAMGQILLGGALSVPLVVMWDIAGTFVNGGDETYNILSYLPPTGSSTYCDRITSGFVMFWMVLGLIAIGWAALQANARIKEGESGLTFSSLWYLLGGLACFFIVDVLKAVSVTIGIDVTMPAICNVIGA